MKAGDHVLYTGDDGEERLVHVLKDEGDGFLTIQTPDGKPISNVTRREPEGGGSGGGQTWRHV